MEQLRDLSDQVSESNDEETKGKRFFACYLLTSLSPRHKGHTYLGFTVNPRRRIRQHNGELRSGEWRTKGRDPGKWLYASMGSRPMQQPFRYLVSCSLKNMNFQFEWAWQHPRESVSVRKVAESFKSFSGFAMKIKLAYFMLNISKWESMDIRVNYFSTKYKKHSAGCPSLPECMKVEIRQMDDLPCYSGSAYFEEDNSSDYEVKGDENGTACEQDDNSKDLQPNSGDSPKKPSRSVSSARSVQALEDIVSSNDSNAEQENIQTFLIVDDNKSSGSTDSREIEIMDISTPPKQRATFGMRRRMTASEIIDLTKSPIFIQS